MGVTYMHRSSGKEARSEQRSALMHNTDAYANRDTNRALFVNIVITGMLACSSLQVSPTHVPCAGLVWWSERLLLPVPSGVQPLLPLQMLRPSLYSLYTGSYVWIISDFILWWFKTLLCNRFFTVCLVILFAAGLGHQQPDWLRHQLVLQHERVGTDLGQSRLSCLQLFTKVSTFALLRCSFTAAWVIHRLQENKNPKCASRVILKWQYHLLLNFESFVTCKVVGKQYVLTILLNLACSVQ